MSKITVATLTCFELCNALVCINEFTEKLNEKITTCFFIFYNRFGICNAAPTSYFSIELLDIEKTEQISQCEHLNEPFQKVFKDDEQLQSYLKDGKIDGTYLLTPTIGDYSADTCTVFPEHLNAITFIQFITTDEEAGKHLDQLAVNLPKQNPFGDYTRLYLHKLDRVELFACISVGETYPKKRICGYHYLKDTYEWANYVNEELFGFDKGSLVEKANKVMRDMGKIEQEIADMDKLLLESTTVEVMARPALLSNDGSDSGLADFAPYAKFYKCSDNQCTGRSSDTIPKELKDFKFKMRPFKTSREQSK